MFAEQGSLSSIKKNVTMATNTGVKKTVTIANDKNQDEERRKRLQKAGIKFITH